MLPIPGWPEKKKQDWQGDNAMTSETTGFNSALSLCEDALRKACEVEKILGVVRKERNCREEDCQECKDIAQVLRQHLIGEE
jgi:hypothetical protein